MSKAKGLRSWMVRHRMNVLRVWRVEERCLAGLDITAEQAREIVLAESKTKGWARPELYQSRNPDVQEVLASLQAIRDSLGATVEIIAQGIYSRRGRFILELIQNVEDCDFNHTDTPSISFEVSPQQIIVESNQDGFTAMDVSQISRTGDSWKRGRRGYVGDKGIGFKSVFKVASRVDIQSNAFSFFFEYNGGPTSEEKLGIITPVVGDDPIPPNECPLTRMTLALNGKTPYLDLVSDFMAIPETLLLFLSKLKQIKLKIHLPDEGRTSSYIFRKFVEANGTTRVSKSQERSDHPDEWRFHVLRFPVEGLPDDPARPEINECEGVLAFPIDTFGRPRLHSGEDIYAFLPVCTVGFNFVLQADFLLQASRQEVIVDSPWNVAIIDHLAEAFCIAMVDFCADPSLRFRWMKYLPMGRAFDTNPLWRKLSSKAIELLKAKRILYPYEPGQQYNEELLSLPASLRTLPPDYLDKNGSPLFADRPGRNRKYLSLCYEPRDERLLRKAFDIEEIEDIHMFHRIKQDLGSPNSRMKHASTTDEWHSGAADLITLILERSGNIARVIKAELDLIPLSDGRWVTASSQTLYFPAQTRPIIPTDLVTTIHQEAANNTSREKMFRDLGVLYISAEGVIDRLWTSYLNRDGASNLGASKAHLMYLYWHHERIDDARFSRMWLYSSEETKVMCQLGRIYMPSDEEYGPRELFKAVPDPENGQRLVPECTVTYIHSVYIDSFTPDIRRYDLSWLDWLERALGVRRKPRLRYDAGSLSAEFRHILRYRPEKIVRLLGMHWASYRSEMSNRIEEEISQAQVKCLGASSAIMSSTYFPLQSLTAKAESLGILYNFPFLDVPHLSEDDRAFEDWRFLERFGVKFGASLNFYLDVLRQHGTHVPQTWDNETRNEIRNGILRTYELISDHCNEISRAQVIEIFAQGSLILHPSVFQPDSGSGRWLGVQDCVWRGPENLLDKVPLATIASYRNKRKVEYLFCGILGIRNANWCDYRDKLLQFSTSLAPPPDMRGKVLSLYTLLSKCRLSDEDWGSLLTTIENNRLIYSPEAPPGWFAPSQCLWASPVPIQGKAILEASYPEELQPFFRDRMRISPADIDTLVGGLCSLAQGNPSVADVKELIWAINAMDPKKSDLRPLAPCNILPVRRERNGSAEVSMQSSESKFGVIDRSKLADIFKEHVGLLDFTLEEVRQLDPFLHGLNLSKKYLSVVCVEKTACSDSGDFDFDLIEKFEERAYYLLRCAVSSRSPLVRGGALSLYNQLSRSIVIRTDGISTQYTIHHENGDIVGPVTQNTGHVHVQEEDSLWRIFVPRNRDAREVCYVRELPHALTKLFKISQSASENISHVLNSSLAVIDELLERGGIGKVPGIEPPPRRAAEDVDEHGINLGDEEASEGSGGEEPRHFGRQDTPSSSIFGEGGLRLSPRQVPRPRRTASPIPPPRTPSPPHLEREDHLTPNAYLHLLTNIIRIARQTTLPHNNQPNERAQGQHHANFDHDAAFGPRSQGQMNHDVKIGAAGELFVYECLKTLLGASFSPVNWTSTIRTQVFIHPEYSAMGAWSGRREISDLQYIDTSSILTQFLIHAGYLDENVWIGATPDYLIEVKTTTGGLGDRFYMSGGQFRLMQGLALEQGRVSQKVYVIFRVFDLGRESLGVKIYVDPEAHRGRDLVFAEHTWAVTPV